MIHAIAKKYSSFGKAKRFQEPARYKYYQTEEGGSHMLSLQEFHKGSFDRVNSRMEPTAEFAK